jgi:hypothetical protein
MQSVARSVLRRAGAGKFIDYQLETVDDLAAVFVRIAWRKCCRRMREREGVVLWSDLAGDSGDGEEGRFDFPDPRADPVAPVLREEMREEVGRAVDELYESLECIDRVILQNKLAEHRVTHAEIAQQVVKQCGYKKCSEKTIQLHWKDIKDRLRQLLKPETP